MESDLDGLANRLRLTEEEEAVVIVSADHTKSSEERSWLCLVGRILTHRPVNAEAFRSTMAAVWKPIKGMQFKALGDNLFLFQFNHIVDKNRVLARGPWNFDKQLVLLEELDGSLQPSEVQFRSVLFWVHVIDLPIIGMTKEVGALIGNSIGTFADMDYAEGGVAWGKSLRIRVAINIHKPLRRGMKITLGQKDPVWLSFKYERLPNFCFACGILGHNQRECDLKLIGQHAPGGSEVQYGSWLRADNVFGQRRLGMFPSAGGVSDRQPAADRDDGESSAHLSRSFVRESGIIPAARKEGVKDFGQTRLQSISLNNDPGISQVGVEANFSGLHGDVLDVVQCPKFQNVVGRELAGSDLEIEDQITPANNFCAPVGPQGGVVGSVQSLVDFTKVSSLSGLQSTEGHSPNQDVAGMSTAAVVCGEILGVHAKTKRNWKRLARKGSGEDVVKQVSDRKRKGEITSSRPTVDGSELAKKMKSNIAVGVVVASWMQAFPHARVLHLVCTTSDHVPILIDVAGHKSTPCNQGWRSPIYRFEAMWLREEECEDIVRNNWSLEGDSTVRDLRRNLESVRSGLLSWSQTKFGDVRRRVRDKAVFNNIKRVARVIVQRVCAYLQEFCQVGALVQGLRVCPPPSRWRPPSLGMVKINFDAATFADLKSIGVGVIVRETHGRVIAAMSERLPHWVDAVCAEALASKVRLHLGELGCVIFI
ncbi:Uncharacterized protein LOK49_Contig11G00008 [Camellia lanceoleosa]|nr:Uncharacterized protein LOK49_Contig11G00008 [Camellia lanceoleosa]